VDGRPFASIGRVVTTGDTLLLIEILNVRMPIVVQSTGVVVAVEVCGGETVEFNQILAVVKIDKS
jgi:biotin carboxyl carrier protein